MNDDLMKKLERELAELRPAELPSELRARLKDEPAENLLTLADRVLATFCGVGAVAAMVIVAVGIAVASGPTPPRMSPSDVAAQREMAVEYQRLMAMR